MNNMSLQVACLMGGRQTLPSPSYSSSSVTDAQDLTMGASVNVVLKVGNYTALLMFAIHMPCHFKAQGMSGQHVPSGMELANVSGAIKHCEPVCKCASVQPIRSISRSMSCRFCDAAGSVSFFCSSSSKCPFKGALVVQVKSKLTPMMLVMTTAMQQTYTTERSCCVGDAQRIRQAPTANSMGLSL